MSEYTPTKYEVLEAWVAHTSHDQPTAYDLVEASESFNRWLAAHDRQVQAEGAVSALRQAADLAEPFSGAALPSSPSRPMFAVWLRDRADRIEEGLRRLGVGATTVAPRPVQDDATSTTHQEEP